MLNDQALDAIFRSARSQNGWQPKPVSEDQIRAIYDLMKMGPTSANCSPARILFLRTPEAKERLVPALLSSNIEKVRSAPVVAIIGHDLKFYDSLAKLFPHNLSARNWFAGDANKAVADATAFRNSTLQGAYLMIAARALGLDCGPLSGFDPAKVDAEFFAGADIRTNFVTGIGYGDPSKVMARSPRLEFDEACKFL
ncbi:MAG: malonic semialdehyde reductase [Burkholderiaceae bacterium]